MKILLTAAFKDLKLLARDRMGFFFVIGFPLLMALFFGSIFSGDGGAAGSMDIALSDQDRTPGSAAFGKALDASETLQIIAMEPGPAMEKLKKGEVTAVLVLKKGFGDGTGLFFGSEPLVEVTVDPSRKAEREYLRGILIQKAFEGLQKKFNDPGQMRELARQGFTEIQQSEKMDPAQKMIYGDFMTSLDAFYGGVDPKAGGKEGSFFKEPAIRFVDFQRDRRGPRSYFEISFPQAVMWGIIACAAAFAISLVQERLRGTYLRLLMAPIGKAHILGGKAIGCFLACLLDMTLILGVGALFFNVRAGDPGLLVPAMLCTAFCFSGVMMFVSVLGRTEQGVSGASWALLLVFSMAGGGMIPLVIMPKWLVTLGHFSPVKWGILAFEGAIWRGFGPADMLLPCGLLVLFGLVYFAIGLTIFARRGIA